jgi:hypothetical protein
MAWANDTKKKRDEQNRTRSANTLRAERGDGAASECEALNFLRFTVADELLAESEDCAARVCIAAGMHSCHQQPEKRAGGGGAAEELMIPGRRATCSLAEGG